MHYVVCVCVCAYTFVQKLLLSHFVSWKQNISCWDLFQATKTIHSQIEKITLSFHGNGVQKICKTLHIQSIRTTAESTYFAVQRIHSADINNSQIPDKTKLKSLKFESQEQFGYTQIRKKKLSVENLPRFMHMFIESNNERFICQIFLVKAEYISCKTREEITLILAHLTGNWHRLSFFYAIFRLFISLEFIGHIQLTDDESPCLIKIRKGKK